MESKRKGITATVYDSGEKVRVRVGLPGEKKGYEYDTGINLERVWVGRKWIIAEFYSRWVPRNGYACKGTYFTAYPKSSRDILEICDKLGLDPDDYEIDVYTEEA